MEKHTAKQDGRARTIPTLGGDYALKWDDETQTGVNAHAALLSRKNRGKTPPQPANRNRRGDTPLTSTAIFRFIDNIPQRDVFLQDFRIFF